MASLGERAAASRRAGALHSSVRSRPSASVPQVVSLMGGQDVEGLQMFAVKNYQQGPQRLVAACDEELLGTSHRQDKFRPEVPASFYDGMRVGPPELGHFLRSATVANLVGERAVALAIELGLVETDHVLTIGGVPHAQFMVLEP